MELARFPVIHRSATGTYGSRVDHRKLPGVGLDEPAPEPSAAGIEETTEPVIEPKTVEAPQTTEIPVLCSKSHKTYMSVHAITSRDSKQWKYIHESGHVKTDERGFLICDGEYIGVALGQYFGDIGSKYIFTLSTGIQLKLCKVEAKALKDTRADKFATHDGNVIEFVVDTHAQYMKDNVWANGYIFSGNFNNSPEFEGEIIKIEQIGD